MIIKPDDLSHFYSVLNTVEDPLGGTAHYQKTGITVFHNLFGRLRAYNWGYSLNGHPEGAKAEYVLTGLTADIKNLEDRLLGKKGYEDCGLPRGVGYTGSSEVWVDCGFEVDLEIAYLIKRHGLCITYNAEFSPYNCHKKSECPFVSMQKGDRDITLYDFYDQLSGKADLARIESYI